MKIKVKEAFVKAVEKTDNTKVLAMVYKVITEVSAVSGISQIKNIKKMKGFKTFYRIRIGDYRIGISVERGEATFLTFAHRKDIYKKFP